MKLKPAQVRAAIVLAVGLLIIGFTVWRTFPHIRKPSLLDPKKYKFMHCPECDAETRFDLDGVDKPCKECGYEKGLIPTEESLKIASAKSPYGKMVAFVLPELILLLGALWFVLKPRAADLETFRFMRCPNCSQKLRYRSTQVGNLGACSRCRKPLRFPEGEIEETAIDGGTTVEDVSDNEEE